MEMFLSAMQSHAYYNCVPYPRYAFGPTQWTPEKGPIPTPLPYAQTLITEGAEFIFRNGPPSFSVADDEDAEGFIRDVISQNEINAQWIALAENAAHQGAVAARFSIDMEEEFPVQVSFLDIPQECRVWVDPHNVKRILMARVQYPYRDLGTGEWFYFREEWTDDKWVTYKPKYAAGGNISSAFGIASYMSSMGDVGDWTVDEETENPFGLIPFTVIRNRLVKGNPLGEGDLWRLFRLMDRIALTMHGEDRANQLHSQPIPVFQNARPENEGPLSPGEPIVVVNNNPDGAPASVIMLEPHGNARAQTQWTIEKWENLLYKGAGLSLVNPAEVTNKGNMTALAFAMTYGRSIATSDRKRELWGESGMGVFFKNMLIGCQRYGGIKQLGKVNDDTTVSVEWPPYFEDTSQDLSNTTDRTAQQVDAGFLTPDRGAERIARAEKMPAREVDKLLKELKGQRTAQTRAKNAALKAAKDRIAASGDMDETANIGATQGVSNFTG